MTELILRLFELIRELWATVRPWHVLQADETGLVLRLGRFCRMIEPGLRWKWPLLETVRSCNKALDTNLLPTQTLTTSDGQTVVLRGIISYAVEDAKRYILDCNDADGVLNDTVVGAIARLAPQYTAEEILTGDKFSRALRLEARRRAKPFGIYVRRVQLADRVKIRAYRLMT